MYRKMNQWMIELTDECIITWMNLKFKNNCKCILFEFIIHLSMCMVSFIIQQSNIYKYIIIK